MGSVLHPVGRQPSGVYWFRRLLAVVLVVLVVLAGWWLFFGRGGGSEAAGTPTTHPSSSSPAATASQTPSPSITPTPTPTATPTATPTTSPSPTSTVAPLCADSAIRVLAQTDKGSYSSSEEPRFTLQVTNAGTTACRRDLGQSALELVVSKGSTRTWSSDDCNPGGGSAVATLRPGQTFSTTVIWSRQTSKPGCPAGQPAASPGDYQLVARDLTLHSAPALFTLH